MVNSSELFFGKIDYPALRDQKLVLLDVIDCAEQGRIGNGDFNAAPYLYGVLHLIDSIQDHAVDVLGVPTDTVFGSMGRDE